MCELMLDGKLFMAPVEPEKIQVWRRGRTSRDIQTQVDILPL